MGIVLGIKYQSCKDVAGEDDLAIFWTTKYIPKYPILRSKANQSHDQPIKWQYWIDKEEIVNIVTEIPKLCALAKMTSSMTMTAANQ